MVVVDAIIVESGEGEAPHFPTKVTDCTVRRVIADKGLSSTANRACVAEAGIMFRATRGHPLSLSRICPMRRIGV